MSDAAFETRATIVHKRRLLIGATVGFAIVGLALVLQAFVGSMSPNVAAQNNHELEIPLSTVPANGVIEVSWHGFRVFLTRENGIKVFSFPYMDGKYWLPDPTWERPALACGNFAFEANKFQCLDFEPGESKSWQWSIDGKSLDPYFSDLHSPRYTLLRDRIVLGRTAKNAPSH